MMEWTVAYEAGRKAERKEVIEWLEQESCRHKGKVIGDSFDRVLRHYCQHKDISLDKFKEWGIDEDNRY